MDDRLEKALQHANYKSALLVKKQNNWTKYQSELLYSISGGTFRADISLMAFLAAQITSGQTDCVVVDIRNNPIMIDDLVAFNAAITDTYFQATNRYYAENEKLKRARTVKALAKL